jgi:flagellum-specific ATP synthase
MPMPSLLAPYFRRLETCSANRWSGQITKAVGQIVESQGPACSVGEQCEIIDRSGRSYPAEVVGFRNSTVLSMPLGRPEGIRYGDQIVASGEYPMLRVGEELLGRVIDATGKPIDDGATCQPREAWPLHAAAPLALERTLIQEPLGCGIRAIDGFMTCGRGQRIGIFGGSGVGKSVLIGMMARGSAADVTVLSLVGERGREVGEFLEKDLGVEGLKRSVVVVSTSDQSPVLRIRGALAATAVAEYFSSRGKSVLLVLDSLTRVAMAQREIGLAAGEPPTSKGYTPSVFTLLARLVERAGNFGKGSITAFYSVLMEGDDQQDPIVDAVRSLLDGHIILDRKLAARNHYPAVSVLDSLSRLMSTVCPKEAFTKARQLRKLMAAYAAAEDLIRVGAYQKGLDAVLDQAVASLPGINKYLQQEVEDITPLDKALQALVALPG